MKILNTSFKTILLFSSVAFFAGCDKVNVAEPLGDAGQTIVKIPSDEGFNLNAIDLTATSQNLNIIEVRRDVHNEASLNSTLKVTIQEDPSVITAYNAAHNTTYIPLPANSYIVDPSNPNVNGQFTVTFNPGEFSKALKIIIPNATVLDPNLKYAMGFKIVSIEGNGKASAELNNVVVEVGVKNRWDGIYKVTGTLLDLTTTAITGYYPLTWELRTTGSNTVVAYDRDFTGTPTHIIQSGAALSQYGTYGLIITFDPATNKITSVTNFYGQLAGGLQRSAALDPSGVNAYDPVTKTIRIKYLLQQGATYTTRTIFDEVWQYTGPR